MIHDKANVPVIILLLKARFFEKLKLRKFTSTLSAKSLVCLIVFGLVITFNGNVSAYNKAPEQLIKVGFLYKFFFFVKWPEPVPTKQLGSISIGILGEDDFGDHFNQIEGKVIKSLNKKVTVKRFGVYRKGLDLKKTEILFISSSEKKNIKKILADIRGYAVLTVADTKGFVEKGGMINLVHYRGHIRWELNLPAIKDAGLKIDSVLIQSAVRVKPVQ